MRLISRYKNFIFSNTIPINCPLKVLKFHRTKWKKLQKFIKYAKTFSFSRNNYNLKNFLKKKEKRKNTALFIHFQKFKKKNFKKTINK